MQTILQEFTEEDVDNVTEILLQEQMEASAKEDSQHKKDEAQMKFEARKQQEIINELEEKVKELQQKYCKTQRRLSNRTKLLIAAVLVIFTIIALYMLKVAI